MFKGPEAHGELRSVFDVLRERSIVRPAPSAGAADCGDCGRGCSVEYLVTATGGRRGYIHCPDCGIAEVRPELLERWELDTAAFLAAALRGLKLSLKERASGQLWCVGKATWAGRSREVWFARAFRRQGSAEAIDALESHPRAIVFAPTDQGAKRWQAATGNLAIGLESTLSLTEGALVIDTDFVEGRILDAGMGPDAVPRRRATRRGERASNIEKLTMELVAHLRAARDHACETQERTGQPELLPRPLRKDLGALAGLKKDQVTKCFQDAKARELNLYWDLAADLERVMRWSGPVKRGPAT